MFSLRFGSSHVSMLNCIYEIMALKVKFNFEAQPGQRFLIFGSRLGDHLIRLARGGWCFAPGFAVVEAGSESEATQSSFMLKAAT